MRRRSRASSKLAKALSHKAKTLKAARRSSSSVDRKEAEVARLRRERDDALERETATSQVLRLISKSPGNLELVFRSILENATRICGAKFGTLYLWDGDAFRVAALHNVPPALANIRRREPIRPGPKAALTRLLRTKDAVHIPDATADEAYLDRDPLFVTGVQLGGFRTFVCVPLLKENEVVGAISIYRREVRPFTDKQIELVSNFAAQAVIAIENTRLLNELRQRTDDLSESLEQQTATSEVLRVISSSPGELEPVFQILLENAVRLSEANFGSLYLYDGEMYRIGALHNTPAAYAELRRREPMFRAGPATSYGRVAATKQVIHIADISADQAYTDRDHRLVGEGLEQCDLFLGKRPHLHATDQNRSDRLPLPQQRSGERRSMTISPSRVRPFRKFPLRRLQIRDVHRGPINDGSSDYQTTSYRTHRSDWPLREGAMFCDQP